MGITTVRPVETLERPKLKSILQVREQLYTATMENLLLPSSADKESKLEFLQTQQRTKIAMLRSMAQLRRITGAT